MRDGKRKERERERERERWSEMERAEEIVRVVCS